MKKIIFIVSAAFLLLSSCKKEVDQPGETAAVKVANEWWVQLTVGGQDIYGIGHFLIATYNTSANDNTIWIDDYQNGWQAKFKANVDYNTLKFTAQAAQNEYYNITIDLKEGQVFPRMGLSKAGNVADSIHLQLEFSDDPGTIYEMNGVERTKFDEDDYH